MKEKKLVFRCEYWTLYCSGRAYFSSFPHLSLVIAVLCVGLFSQFGDLYEEEYFIDYLKDDVRIVKELPFELRALDLEEIEAVVSSALILVF